MPAAERKSEVKDVSLADSIKNFAAVSFREHYKDCQYEPKKVFKTYERSHDIEPLSKHQRDNMPNLPDNCLEKSDSGLVTGYKMERVKAFYKKRYKFFSTQLRDWNLKEPDFLNPEAVYCFWRHYSNELMRERDFYRSQRKFNKRLQTMTLKELSASFPDLLHFQPSRFELPPEADYQYWARRTTKYLHERCQRSKLKAFLSCHGDKDKDGNPFLTIHRVFYWQEEKLSIPVEDDDPEEMEDSAEIEAEEFDFKAYYQEKLDMLYDKKKIQNQI